MTSRIKTNAIWAGLCSFFSSDLEGIKIFSWDAKIIVALDTVSIVLGDHLALTLGSLMPAS